MKILFNHENSSNDIPLERASLLDGTIGAYSRFGAFKSLINKNLKAKSIYSLHLEYNFQDLLFEFLNLSTISNYGTELSLFSSYGKYNSFYDQKSYNEIFEYGVSIKNILGLLEVNGIYNHNDKKFIIGVGSSIEF
jgi:hypothetical protein